LFEAGVLAVLFVSQLFFPNPQVRYGFAVVYVGLAAAILVRQRKELRTFLRMGFKG